MDKATEAGVVFLSVIAHLNILVETDVTMCVSVAQHQRLLGQLALDLPKARQPACLRWRALYRVLGATMLLSDQPEFSYYTVYSVNYTN
jgi:hypothetical protein